MVGKQRAWGLGNSVTSGAVESKAEEMDADITNPAPAVLPAIWLAGAAASTGASPPLLLLSPLPLLLFRYCA
jgi:hypothetical protein